MPDGEIIDHFFTSVKSNRTNCVERMFSMSSIIVMITAAPVVLRHKSTASR